MASRFQQLLQFSAVLRKNFILQTRSRRSILGISGWGALLVQILLPVAFFSLMCVPKYYIQPYQHPVFLQSQEYDIDTKWWAGASPYEGNSSNCSIMQQQASAAWIMHISLRRVLSCSVALNDHASSLSMQQDQLHNLATFSTCCRGHRRPPAQETHPFSVAPGPAFSSGGNARVVFVPNTPEVQSLARRVAMAVSCPSEAYKRICSAASVTTFACLFGVTQAPAGCEVCCLGVHKLQPVQSQSIHCSTHHHQ